MNSNNFGQQPINNIFGPPRPLTTVNRPPIGNQTPWQLCQNSRRTRLRKVNEVIKTLMAEIDQIEMVIEADSANMNTAYSDQTWDLLHQSEALYEVIEAILKAF